MLLSLAAFALQWPVSDLGYDPHSLLPLAVLAAVEEGSGPGVEPVGPYATEREEPWNRVHRAVFHRRDAQGVLHGARELDPLLADHSTWLLALERAREAESALESALAHPELVADRSIVARAVFQRDLWAVHDWLVAYERRVDETSRAQAVRLSERTAALMRLVALAPDDLAKLDAQALAATQTLSDPDLRELLGPEGANSSGWILLQDAADSETPLALGHATHFGARSAFTVHLCLPEGRAAGEAYLQRLRAGPTTVVVDGEVRLSPELPEPSIGTQVALVRRALHLDSTGQLHITACIEDIQVRRFPRLDAPNFDPGDATQYAPETWRAFQDVREFVLDRSALATGQLRWRPIGPTERKVSTFGTHGEDPLDHGGLAQRPFQLASCTFCHGAVGAQSILSLTNTMVGPGGALEAARSAPFGTLVPDRGESWRATALRWSRSRAEFERLQKAYPH